MPPDRPAGRPHVTASPGWSTRLWGAADEVFWAAKLNGAWMLFSLAGGVVAGVGPATLAAYALARRHARGESFQCFPAFWVAYRREFRRGSLLVLPLLATAGLLVSNYDYFSSYAWKAPLMVTGAAIIALVLIGAYALPMAVHYNAPVRSYVPKASLFALTRPAASVLLLFCLAALVFATMTFPLLGLVLSVGAWIQLDTWLCLRFFAENEARLLLKEGSS